MAVAPSIWLDNPVASTASTRPTGFGSANALLGRPETLIDADIDDSMSVAMESIGQAVSQLESGRGGVGAGSGQLIPGAGGAVTPGKKRKSKGGGGSKTDPKKNPRPRLQQLSLQNRDRGRGSKRAASDFFLVGVELLELSGANTLPPASSASGASTGPPSAEAEGEPGPGPRNGAGEDEESRLFLSEVPFGGVSAVELIGRRGSVKCRSGCDESVMIAFTNQFSASSRGIAPQELCRHFSFLWLLILVVIGVIDDKSVNLFFSHRLSEHHGQVGEYEVLWKSLKMGIFFPCLHLLCHPLLKQFSTARRDVALR